MTSTKLISNALTVDVEDYFQVSAFADRVCRHDWDKYECRVEINTDRLLSIFDDAEVQGTFFVLGWIAERYPSLVRRIADAGHEIASHGYWHQLIYNLTPEEFENDITASREAICNACGIEVTAYRAPSFSIVPHSRWALDILAKNRFTIDSSIFPIRGHDRYGDPNAPKSIHKIQTQHGNITEFPPTAASLGRFPLPIGGGYFRLLPFQVTRFALNQVRRSTGPAMFYIHPWEVDFDQPRIPNATRRASFRHYINLKRTECRLRKLLAEFRFGTLGEVLRSSQNRDSVATVPSNRPTALQS